MRNALLMLLCGLAVAAPVASAQDDEVFVDPGSPSGKEYALPLDQARQQGASESQKAPSAAARGNAPLFGEGVGGERSATGGERGQASRGGDGGASAAAGAADAKRSAAEGAPADAAGKRISQAAAPAGTGIGVILAAGAGVLVLGALLGLLLRRRARR